MPTISSIMKKEVEVVRPDSTIHEAMLVLCNHGISGAPVLSNSGKLVGIISEYAMMDVLFDPELKNAKVSDLMTSEVHCLRTDDTLTHAVHMFAVYGVRRLPVIQDEKLVGIISRRELMKACLDLTEPLAAPLQEYMPELATSTNSFPESIVEPVDFA